MVAGGSLLALPLIAALPVGQIDTGTVIDFESEVLPFLRSSCLACHNETKSKAGLILETPQSILSGGDSGPAVVAGEPEQSLLYIAAAHLDEDVVMPPVGNKSNAVNLSPEELARLRLWIIQGAEGEVRGQRELDWQPVARRVQPVYAMAFSETGRYVAYGRGSEAAIYEMPTRRHVARLVDTKLGSGRAHRDLVNAIAFHPSGDLIATGGFRELKLWERRSKVEHFSVAEEGEAPVSAVSVSADGLTLAMGSTDGSFRVKSLATQQVLWEVPANELEVTGLFLGPTGDEAIVACGGEQARLLRLTGELVVSQSLALDSPLESVAWGDRGQFFASLTHSGQVRAWFSSTDGGYVPGELILAEEGVAIACMPGGNPVVVVGFANGDVHLFNGRSGGQVRTFAVPSGVKHIAVNPVGDRILVASSDGLLTAVKNDEEKERIQLQGARVQRHQLESAQRTLRHRRGALSQLVSDMKKAADDLKKQRERLKKADSALAEKRSEADKVGAKLQEEEGRHRAALEARKKLDDDYAQVQARHLAALDKVGQERAALRGFVLEGIDESSGKAVSGGLESFKQGLDQLLEAVTESAAVSGETKVALAEFDARIDERRKTLQAGIDEAAKAVTAQKKRESDAKRAMLLAENEKELASQSVDKLLLQEKLDEERKTAAAALVKQSETLLSEAESLLVSAQRPFAWIGFSSSGDRILGFEPDGALNVWWAETGEELSRFESSKRWNAELHALTDESVLLLDRNGEADVFSLRDEWLLKRTIAEEAGFADRINALDFSPDGRWLAAGGGDPSRSGEILLWNVETMELEQRHDEIHSDVVFGLQFSPDSLRLASGSADRFARVLDLQSQEVQHSLEGHTHYVMDVAWQSNGKNLVSAGADGIAKIWDSASGERKKNIEGFKKELTGVGFVGESDEIFASGGDAILAVYGLDGKKRRSMDGAPGFLFSESMSTDGRYVAAGGMDGVVRVWELASGEVLTTLE